jgi:hypothetical protein
MVWGWIGVAAKSTVAVCYAVEITSAVVLVAAVLWAGKWQWWYVAVTTAACISMIFPAYLVAPAFCNEPFLRNASWFLQGVFIAGYVIVCSLRSLWLFQHRRLACTGCIPGK